MDIDRYDDTRIWQSWMPALDEHMEAVAGWNGNYGSYYYSIWYKSTPPGSSVSVGDVYLEGGYPLEIIPDLACLFAEMCHSLNLHSPLLVRCFRMLLHDRMLDAANYQFARSPTLHKHVPELIQKVLDYDESPLLGGANQTVMDHGEPSLPIGEIQKAIAPPPPEPVRRNLWGKRRSS